MLSLRLSQEASLMGVRIRVLLLTNYREDQQRSMLRFADLLLSHLPEDQVNLEEIHPKAHLRKLCPFDKWKKWTGYLDKYLLFHRSVTRRLQSNANPIDLVHVIDHSNAVYLPKIRRITSLPKLLTCHDLIALRTARNECPKAPRTSASGKRLQGWIHRSISYADAYACDSSRTEMDLNRITPASKGRSEVIHLGVLSERGDDTAIGELPFNPKKTRFLLHVGSSAWYKNRKRLFNAFVDIKEGENFKSLKLVLVGPVPQPEELTEKTEHWFKNNPNELIVLSDLSESGLQTLYEHANAFIFPSLIEGFGWPPLEARSLGCSVIASRTGAMDDILGSSATYVDPMNTKDIVAKIKEVLDADRANEPPPHIPKARECAQAYENLYQRLVESK
jgi:glycosyltransferase involved in cell wall biosynthesis